MAQVGDDLIDEREFRRYEAQIQPQHHSLAHGVEKHREHLMAETLCTKLAESPIREADAVTEAFQIDGEQIRLEMLPL